VEIQYSTAYRSKKCKILSPHVGNTENGKENGKDDHLKSSTHLVEGFLVK